MSIIILYSGAVNSYIPQITIVTVDPGKVITKVTGT